MKLFAATILAIATLLSICRTSATKGDAMRRAELSMDDAATLPQRQVESRLPNSHGAVYYAYAARLFKEGKKEEAVFWFSVGQLRFRFDLAAHPDSEPSGGPALLASMNFSIGFIINEWAAGNIETWLRQINRALEWDSGHANGVTSKTAYKKEYQETRDGLRRLRETIVSRADEIKHDHEKRLREREGEPHGAANGSQPFRSETNPPSSAAGSRR